MIEAGLPPYLSALLTILVSLIVAGIVVNLLSKYLHNKAKRHTDNTELIKRTTRPVLLLIILTGLYQATSYFTLTYRAARLIDGFTYTGIVLLIAYILTQGAKLLIRRHVKGDVIGEHAPKFLGNVVGIIIFIPAVLIILARFNIEITPILATLGVGSLAVGLALQGTLGNFFAGLRLISEKPIKVGDYVEILERNVEGFIEDIGWSTTRVRTIRDNIVVVPNSSFVESNLFNSSLPSPESTVLLETGVSYDENLEHVERVCKEVISYIQDTHDDAVSDHEPWVRFKSFDDSNISVRLGIRVKSYDKRYGVFHELIKALKARFDDEDIEISWPIRKIYDMQSNSTV
jgi:small-conductance mechanosensitive channel